MSLHFSEIKNPYEGREEELEGLRLMIVEDLEEIIEFLKEHTEFHDELAPEIQSGIQGITNKVRSYSEIKKRIALDKSRVAANMHASQSNGNFFAKLFSDCFGNLDCRTSPKSHCRDANNFRFFFGDPFNDLFKAHSLGNWVDPKEASAYP